MFLLLANIKQRLIWNKQLIYVCNAWVCLYKHCLHVHVCEHASCIYRCLCLCVGEFIVRDFVVLLMCMYLCVFVCKYVQSCIGLCVCMWACMCMRVHSCMCACVNCPSACMCVLVHEYECMYVCVSTWVWVHVCVC